MASISRNILQFSFNQLGREFLPNVICRKRICSVKIQHLSYSTNKKTVPTITQVNGETIVRSPYEDLSLPQCSFSEYAFGELEKFSDLALMVSIIISICYYRN